MIEHGHEHFFQPVAKHELQGGGVQHHAACICGLEEQRFFLDGRPTTIRYRYGGLYFSALDLLRIAPLPVEECEECHGSEWAPPEGTPQAACKRCSGLGVTEKGQALTERPLAVTG